MRKKPELLAPAGNMEKLEYAYLYGADAAYISGRDFGMRARAGNFSDEELTEACELARGLGKRLYVTVNIAARNSDIRAIATYLKTLERIRIDAIIVSDPGIFKIASELVDIPIHISTQANSLNYESVLFWSQLGAKRVCLARELSKNEISDICAESDIEIEVFIHGAMCISYSGRCLISKYLADRDANEGDCAQPCRWQYYLVEGNNPSTSLPIFESKEGTFLYNSKDLCLAAKIPELIEAGCSAFKIEGRMKSINYVAAVTKVYRTIIDEYTENPSSYTFDPAHIAELECISHRTYTEGFFSSDCDARILGSSGYDRKEEFVAIVESSDNSGSTLLVKDYMSTEDTFICVPSTGKNKTFKINRFINQDTAEIRDKAHANEHVYIEIPDLPYRSIIRSRGGRTGL